MAARVAGIKLGSPCSLHCSLHCSFVQPLDSRWLVWLLAPVLALAWGYSLPLQLLPEATPDTSQPSFTCSPEAPS